MSKTAHRLLLLEKARDSTISPGVYRMLDQEGRILYIGKAKNLRNRLVSYFQELPADAGKTKVLVSKVRNFELILTDTESEALILEAVLIKKHKPRYNIALKDDKSYPYVMVDEGHTYPKLVYTRRPRKRANQRIFGPFAAGGELRIAVRTLTQSFQLRDCSDAEFANRSRPCINHQIGICSAPCTAQITPDDYRRDLEKALRVLNGKGQDVIRELQEEMERFSAREEFEDAARIRDKIQLLENAMSTGEQKVSRDQQTMRDVERDALGWCRRGTSATISLLAVRRGQLIDTAHFHFDDIEERTDAEILELFLSQHYLTENPLDDAEDSAAPIAGAERKLVPREILLPFAYEGMDIFAEGLLKLGHKSEASQPQRGEKRDLVEMANKNAENAFLEHQRDRGDVFRALADLKARLRIENYPRRMECFDISNLGDSGIVASRVVFIEGKPNKSLYRHYKIRSTDTQNDFAAMREVLTRRLQHSVSLQGEEPDEEAPDLIVVDGGKGQLSMAVEVMRELNVTGIDLVSLAKAKTTPDFREREALKTFERVYKPGRANPIALAPDSAVCHLLERLRDEAHRFALTFQRKQRTLD